MKKQITTMMAILLLIGCASAPKRLDTPASDEYTLYARGLSTDQAYEEDADIAAEADAKNRLSGMIETHVKSLTKRAREQIGVGKDAELNSQFTFATKQTVDQSLNFTSLHNSVVTTWDKKRDGFRAEIILKVNIGPINERMLDNIKQRQNLYERFRTSELFNELEDEIDKKRVNKNSE